MLKSTSRNTRVGILHARVVDVLRRELLAFVGAYSHALDKIEAAMARDVGDEALEFL